MSPLAIWCCEAQERYVLAIKRDALAMFDQFAKRERCPYAKVGTASLTPTLTVQDSYFDNTPIDIPMSVLFGSTPTLTLDVKASSCQHDPIITADINLSDAINRVLQLPSVASKQFLITIGDRTVGGLTHRDQMVGPWQVPVADCAVTLTDFHHHSGEAMAIGERAPIAVIDAAASARMAVGEAITNLLSAPVAKLNDIKLSANWMAACGEPNEDANLYAAVKAVGLELCPALGICIPVGKDSLSMKTRWQHDETEQMVISPVSLNISAFAPVDDVRLSLTPALVTLDEPTQLYLIDLSEGKQRLGGSALAQVYKQVGDSAPNVDSPNSLCHFCSGNACVA